MQDEVVELVELGEALPGLVRELVLPQAVLGVEAEQDGVEGVQVDHGAVRVRVVGGLLHVILWERNDGQEKENEHEIENEMENEIEKKNINGKKEHK